MATLDELRPKLRIQLSDTDDNRQIWTDDELDEYFTKSLDVYDSYVPLLAHSDVSWTSLGATIGVEPRSDGGNWVGINNMIHIIRVELPIDQDPPVYLPFTFGIGPAPYVTIIGPTKPQINDLVRFYARIHTSLRQIFPHHEQGLLTGAWAYALRARAHKLTTNTNLAIADRLYAASQTALAEFSNFLVLAREERMNYDTVTHDILEDPDVVNRYRARTLEMLTDGTKDAIEQGSMSAADARILINRYLNLTGSPPTTTEAIAAQTNEEKARTLKFVAEATKALISQRAISTVDARMLANLFSDLDGDAPTPDAQSVLPGESGDLALAIQRLGNGLEDLIRQGVMSRQQARQLLNTFASTTGDVPPEDPSAAAGDALSWEG